MVVDLVEKMVKRHGGKYPLINDIIQELEDDNLRNLMDNLLREKALPLVHPMPTTKTRGVEYCSAPRCGRATFSEPVANWQDKDLQGGNGAYLMESGRFPSLKFLLWFYCANILDRDVFTMLKGKCNLISPHIPSTCYDTSLQQTFATPFEL